MYDFDKIIEGCKKNDRKAQKELYDVYAPVLYGICLRYGSDKAEADDILQDGFIKIFTKMGDFKNKGSFEGWMRRIVVNTAISYYYQKKKQQNKVNFEELDKYHQFNDFDLPDFSEEELMKVIRTLPDKYRIVFNMFAIEGYKYKEIEKILDIEIGTLKSQYSRARKMIIEKLEKISKKKLKVNI